jgi:hypothetical protein
MVKGEKTMEAWVASVCDAAHCPEAADLCG